MTEINPALVETILRACEKSAPNPWLPAHDPITRGLSEQEIKSTLEWLDLGGHIQVGYVGESERAAQFPTEMESLKERLRREQSDPYLQEQRKAVREVFQNPGEPRFRRMLIIINVLFFAWAFVLAMKANVKVSDFFIIRTQAAAKILHETGGLKRTDIVKDKWWRLITAGFVHAGIIHILMNMYALFMIGRDVERMYGPVRFLVIYMVSNIGGMAAGIYSAPAVVGASGAICGLIGAFAVWLILNKRCMPKQMFSRNMMSLIFTAVLIALISMMPRVSGMGHLGGAVAGIVTATLMHYQRFSRYPVVRGATVLLALALPVAFVLAAKPVLLSRSDMEGVAGRIRKEESREKIRKAYNEYWDKCTDLLILYDEEIATTLVRHPDRREEENVKKILNLIPKHRDEMKKLQSTLEEAGELSSASIEKIRQDLLKRTKSWLIFFDQVELHLRKEMKWGRDREDAFRGHLGQKDPRNR